MAAAESPPPALRDRVLADIRHIRQLPAPRQPAPTSPAPESSHPRRWRRAVAAAVAAAACLVTAASVTEAVREHQRMERADATSRAIASVLSAPDAHSAMGRTKAGGTVTVVASATRGRAVVASSGLRTLPASNAYQLWLIDRKGPRPAGLLPHNRPIITETWHPSEKLAITIEPASGSPRPTTPPVVLLKP
ncbi:anti-sigma factor [Actinomadura meridiana]